MNQRNNLVLNRQHQITEGELSKERSTLRENKEISSGDKEMVKLSLVNSSDKLKAMVKDFGCYLANKFIFIVSNKKINQL